MSTTGPDDVFLTRGLLRRAALRAALLSAGLALSVWVLIVVPEGGFVSAPMLLLHAALVGLVGVPITIMEAAVARRTDQGWPLHLAAAVVIGLTALVGSSLAWSQVHYTDAMLRRGSLEEGMAATRNSGPITRRPHVATMIFVAPAAGLALAALLTLRRASGRERLVIAPTAGLMLGVCTTWVSLAPTKMPGQLVVPQGHLLAFPVAVAGIAVLAGLIGDALDARLSR